MAVIVNEIDLISAAMQGDHSALIWFIFPIVWLVVGGPGVNRSFGLGVGSFALSNSSLSLTELQYD